MPGGFCLRHQQNLMLSICWISTKASPKPELQMLVLHMVFCSTLNLCLSHATSILKSGRQLPVFPSVRALEMLRCSWWMMSGIQQCCPWQTHGEPEQWTQIGVGWARVSPCTGFPNLSLTWCAFPPSQSIFVLEVPWGGGSTNPVSFCPGTCANLEPFWGLFFLFFSVHRAELTPLDVLAPADAVTQDTLLAGGKPLLCACWWILNTLCGVSTHPVASVTPSSLSHHHCTLFPW